MKLEDLIEELKDNQKKLKVSGLVLLSYLEGDQLRSLEQAWPAIDEKKRVQIVQNLLMLAEDDVQLNFDNVFRIGLKDPNAEVKVGSIEGLWECDDYSLIEALLRIARSQEDAPARIAAANSLGKFLLMMVNGEISSRRAEQIEKTLAGIIDNRSEPAELRGRALEAISVISKPAIKKMIEAAYKSEDQRLKLSAVHAMGKNCDPAWLSTLGKELGSPRSEMRYEATRAYGEIGNEDVAPELFALFEDPDPEVRVAAVEALGHIGGDRVKKTLKALLQSKDERMKEAAEEAIAEIGSLEEPLGFLDRSGQ